MDVRENKPEVYLKVIAQIIPKEFHVRDNTLDHMTDDELADFLSEIRAAKERASRALLRHTWASLAVMNGTPLLVVAKNLGHADTRMVERHYGHCAPSFIADAIRTGAPRYRVKADKRVVPLR